MKDGHPAVSILMPSLNVANFIRQCIESVIKQTLKSIEIICIDAGSTDGTLEILREYEKQDQRVRVLVSDEKSYGHQMNLGLDVAQGEYIGIVETDDWVASDMFENIWRVAKQNNVDIVKTNYFWYYTKPEISSKPFENLEGCPYNQVFSPQKELSPLSSAPAIWSGIYRRSMLTNNNIRFSETPGASYQDTSFHFKVFTVAESAYFLNEYYLHYRCDNENSSVKSFEKVFCICDEMHNYEDFLESRSELKITHIKPYMALKHEKYRWNYSRIAAAYQWEFLKLVHDEFAIHKSDGLLEEEYFNAQAWRDINEIIDNPVRYFRNTCKKYRTRPMGAQLPQPAILKKCVLNCPDVSIVIPAFNNENCIARALQSVQEQTFQNVEIICVDDGSDDNTLQVMIDHASTDDRITVLHQVNQGRSSARNNGMKHAKGRYIQFLDSDDAILPNAVENLIALADEKKLDILFFNGSSVYESEELEDKFPYYKNAYEYSPNQKKVLTGREYFCLAIENGKYRVSPCMALYRLNNLKQKNVSFIEGIIHEDNVFSLLTLLNSERIWHAQEKFYVRYVRSDSTMTSPKNFFHVYGLLTCFQTMLEIHHRALYDERFDLSFTREIRHIFNSLNSTYKCIGDKNECRKRLTQEELFVLDAVVCSCTAESKLNQVNGYLGDIMHSRSYKIGRAVTWPIRKIKQVIKCFMTEQNFRKGEPKVLFVSSDSYKMSGAFLSEVVLNKILNKKFKVQTHVVLPYFGSGQNIIDEANVSNHVVRSYDWIVPLDAKNSFHFYVQKYKEHTENLKSAIKIARYALSNKFNIIHSNTSYVYVGYLASKLSGLPHIWHLREFLEEDQNRKIYCKRNGYKMIGNSDRVITISRALYDKYKQVVPEARLRLVYNGISLDSYYSPDKEIFKSNIPILLFLSGSDSPFKGRKDLVEACKKLNDAGVSFELWFVGWCGTDLQDIVHNAGLDSKTRFFGYQKDTSCYFRKADLFFMCSRFEAFGRTTVEAMLNGCLVIGADSAGTRELIVDRETGLLYPYGDADSLFETIRYAFANKEKMCSIADKGRKYMAENMTDVNNAQNILCVYKDVIQNIRKPLACQLFLSKLRIGCACFRYVFRRYCSGPFLEKIENLVTVGTNSEVENMLERGGGQSNPKVSVIVPIYNVKSYLQQCLDSICNQTLDNIEIICVDDGSTDGSAEIVDDYARKDRRFVVIHKKNTGYGASVNIGLEKSVGEYVAIVEADDFIDKNMYSKLYALAIERGSIDIVKSSYWMYYDTDDGKSLKKEPPIKTACHPDLAVFNIFEYPEIIYHHPSIWSCIYKREFINSNKIRFHEAKGAGWVDNPFLIETFCRARRITWTPDAYYYYRQTNPNASSFVKDCSIPFERTKEMLSFLDKENIYDAAIRNSVYKRILWNAASTLENSHYIPEKDDPLIVDQIFQVDPSFILDKRVRDKERQAYAYFKKKINM